MRASRTPAARFKWGGPAAGTDMANQCYHDGDFWQCVTATAANESPTTAAAKWRRIQLPAQFRHVLGELTHAHLLKLDGQLDKFNAVRSAALNGDHGLKELVRRAVNAERHRHRPDVQTR